MVNEITSRRIPGNGGSVIWFIDGGTHWVQVRSPQSEHLSLREFERGIDAREAFNHPFADEFVPNVFDGRLAVHS